MEKRGARSDRRLPLTGCGWRDCANTVAGPWLALCCLDAMEPIFVHHLRVIDANGHEQSREIVACPATGRTQPVEACWSCGRGHGTFCDDRFDAVLVDCDLAPLDSVSAVPGASRDGSDSDPVSMAMSRNVVCVRVNTPVDLLKAAFVQHAVGVLPVVDAKDRPIGSVSPHDLLDERRVGATAEHLMAKDPIVLCESMPLLRAAAILAFEGIHHLMIKTDDGKLAGVLSSLDVCRHVAQRTGSLVPRTTQRQRRAE
jgi:hypothetical protein